LQQFGYNFIHLQDFKIGKKKLKKTLLFLLFISSLYAKEGSFYIGSSYGAYNELFDTQTKVESSSAIANIKVGYGLRKSYAVEFSLDYTKNKSKIFSSSGASDGDKYGFNLDLVKSFDYDIYIFPFVKAGFGAGTMKIERSLQKKLSYGSYNLCGGFFLPLGKTYDLEFGYQYRYVSYQAINTITQRIKYKSHANIAYAGFNIRF